ncbi:hypothetical protein [Pelagicoccus sp. SDUM812002]|uniref:hypothetical protein n=1 Tax=Pelagicoccus sp. SDUM812002 TaxID=3041266 RepID=UPI00280D02AB|nr:hypothetical protein [Pelagicoccus sp. SDUM812002]MDQ8184368.1 hypothetical protein [Pelagicoccus sp. SDUM812002]
MKNTYAILFRSFLSLFFLFASANLSAQSAEKTEFGPYVALERDSNIVKDVKIEENGRIYLLLNPEFKEEEIILKNSSANKSGYRKWFNGELELVSPANQGKAPGEYTDWVTTTGNYIEYYMDGKLILHLAKKSVL